MHKSRRVQLIAFVAIALIVIAGVSGFYLGGARKHTTALTTTTPRTTPLVTSPVTAASGTTISTSTVDFGNVMLSGTVKLVSSNYVVLETKSGTDYDFTVTPQTIILWAAKRSTLSAVKTGDFVQVSGIVQPTGSIRALRVTG